MNRIFRKRKIQISSFSTNTLIAENSHFPHCHINIMNSSFAENFTDAFLVGDKRKKNFLRTI